MFNDKGAERPSHPLPAATEQPRPEQAQSSPLDTSSNTDFAAGLQHPGNTLVNTVAATATTLETGVSRESKDAPPSSRSFFQRASDAAVGLISSNNFYTSFGNVIITSNLWSGALLHPVCALLAVVNESRELRRERSEYQYPSARFSGATQQVVDLWRSPGVYRVALSGAFLVNAAESLSKGDLLFTAIYICASLGNVGAARTLNREYFQNLRKERGTPEPPPESRAFCLATSPGLNWSVTDLLVGIMTLPKTAGMLCMGAASGAAAFAVAALASPLILGARVASSPLPLILNGCSNLGFSAAHAMWGTPTISLACLGWGIASLIIAGKQWKALNARLIERRGA